uniref:PH domain-containing protein n=1 Tax=Alexandrium monilatum TaxID=311494 RepID=A0A7S4S4R6_9DINO
MAGAAIPIKKLRIVNVRNAGETGKFCGNAESMGWMREDGERMVVHPVASVRRAEWFEGQLRILVETDEDPGSEVVAVEGFANEDFDNIWRYFEQSCGVHVKKHRQVAALDPEDFDHAMKGIEDAADRVDETTQGSSQKKGRELDMLKRVENVRDGLDEAVSGDKQALNRVFSANGCERIGRLRLVLDTVQLEVYKKDPRWLHLRNMCKTIESVLKDLGTFRQWRPSEDKEHASLLRRMMVRELKRAQGQDLDDEDEEAEAEDTQPIKGEAAPAPGKLDGDRLANTLLIYGAAHPVYGAPRAEEPPPPPQPPGPAGEVSAPAGAVPVASEPGSEGSDDHNFEDEEVADPNSVRASAPDDKARGGRQDFCLHQTHPGSVLEGWVWKRSRFLRRWRRRWLVLLPHQLMSFKSRSGTVPTETVMSGTVTRVYSADAEVLQSRSFGVALSRRIHYMVCDDDKQKEAWIRQINRALLDRRR